MVHGGGDRRVPIQQGASLRNALEQNHLPVAWAEYKDEPQGFGTPGVRFDFYRQVETFLVSNIGAASSTGHAVAAELAPAVATAH